MKAFSKFIAAAVLVSPAILVAQVTQTSAIVGYDTVTIAGTGGAAGGKLSFSALSLASLLAYQGLATSVGSNTITDPAATWTDNLFNGSNGPHYLEVLSINGSTTAAGVGRVYNITATTAATHTLTLATNLAAGTTAPVGYRVRKHWTLATVFGAANSAGLQGGSSVSADLINVWNGSGYDAYYYQTVGIGGTGWRKVGNQSDDASASVIKLDDCMITKRGQSAAVSFRINGEVKTGQTTVSIVPGHNFVPNPYAVSMTLDSCAIYTGNSTTGLAGGNVTTADQMLIWNGSGYDTYYYQTSGIGGTGWRKSGNQTTDAASTVIASGSGFIVRRVNAGGFTWVIPQHPASL